MDLGQIQQWLQSAGITPAVLVLIGVVALITLFFTSREIVSWYLKIPSLKDEVRLLRDEILDLKQQIQQMSHKQDMSLLASDDDVFDPSKSAEAKKSFRLDH